MVAWLWVPHADDLDVFIGPFPSKMHAEEFRRRVGPELSEAVEEDSPVGVIWTVKEWERIVGTSRQRRMSD